MLFRADYSEKDWADIRAAVCRWRDWFQQGDKQFHRDFDPDDVMRGLRDSAIESVMVGGYLIAFQLGSPWYAPQRVTLEEVTVFRVDPKPRSFRVVPETLLRLAAALPHCTGVVVGTSFTNDDRLKRVYQRYGFKVEAEQLYRSA